MLTYLFYKTLTLTCGLLYPAFCSYKVVKNKNVQGYVHMMMYWITMAVWLFLETFTDVLLGFWFPFYYEIKIIFLIWILSPQTRGGSFVYRKLIHPTINKHEAEIDTFVDNLKDQTSTLLVDWIARGIRTVADLIMTRNFSAKMAEVLITLRDMAKPKSPRSLYNNQHVNRRGITDRDRDHFQHQRGDFDRRAYEFDSRLPQQNNYDQVDSGNGRSDIQGDDSFEDEFSLCEPNLQSGQAQQNIPKRVHRRERDDDQGPSGSGSNVTSKKKPSTKTKVNKTNKSRKNAARSLECISADETDEIDDEDKDSGSGSSSNRLPKSKSTPNVAGKSSRAHHHHDSTLDLEDDDDEMMEGILPMELDISSNANDTSDRLRRTTRVNKARVSKEASTNTTLPRIVRKTKKNIVSFTNDLPKE